MPTKKLIRERFNREWAIWQSYWKMIAVDERLSGTCAHMKDVV